jgi:hypothetical protein
MTARLPTRLCLSKDNFPHSFVGEWARSGGQAGVADKERFGR